MTNPQDKWSAPETGCFWDGKKVRDNHEWYIDKRGGVVCRQCGARQKDGAWLCVDCGASLIQVRNVVVKDASKMKCYKCSQWKMTEEKGGHSWGFWKQDKFQCCRTCGVVRRSDDKNAPCKGKPKLRL